MNAASKERDELKAELAAEQQAVAEARLQAEDLHRHLDQNTEELVRLKAASEKYDGERRRVDIHWREELENQKALTKRVEADWAEALERNVKFEEQLTVVRQEHSELSESLRAEREKAEKATRRLDHFETRAKDLEKRNTELERSEATFRKQLDSAKALAKKLEAAWNGAVERNTHYEEEVASLRQECEALREKVSRAPGIERTRKAAPSRERSDSTPRKQMKTAKQHNPKRSQANAKPDRIATDTGRPLDLPKIPSAPSLEPAPISVDTAPTPDQYDFAASNGHVDKPKTKAKRKP